MKEKRHEVQNMERAQKGTNEPQTVLNSVPAPGCRGSAVEVLLSRQARQNGPHYVRYRWKAQMAVWEADMESGREWHKRRCLSQAGCRKKPAYVCEGERKVQVE